MSDAQKLQVLRTIDKADRDTPLAIFEKLTTGHTDKSGSEVAGAGIRPSQAIAIIQFLGISSPLNRRLKIISFLEDQVIGPGDDNCGFTLWDKLIRMPVCENQTWNDGKRPANIAFAVDDIGEALARGNGQQFV